MLSLFVSVSTSSLDSLVMQSRRSARSLLLFPDLRYQEPANQAPHSFCPFTFQKSHKQGEKSALTAAARGCELDVVLCP